ncbi:MAG: hypothetical protein IJ770_00925 [Alphaproteobacteria bacterium]|nr:hypothetical protein [Alphaproteobacteria bacterium]
MIELLFICVIGTKPTAPCPPPSPPLTEKLVGLPAKEIELEDDESEKEISPLKPAPKPSKGPTLKSSEKPVLKLSKAKAKSSDYNRRGNRNH